MLYTKLFPPSATNYQQKLPFIESLMLVSRMGHQGRCICDWMEDNIFGVFSGNYSPLPDLNRENSKSTPVKVSLLVESICGYPPSKCQCLRKHFNISYVEWNSIWWRCEGLLYPSLTWIFPPVFARVVPASTNVIERGQKGRFVCRHRCVVHKAPS